MENEEFAVFARDSEIPTKTKWYLKNINIFIIGILLGTISNLCISAIINLTIDDELKHILIMWQRVPINVWISIISFVLFIMFVYYFKLAKNKNEK